MTRPTVGIVGLGQIGGSLAAALTRRRLARVVGATRRPETARRALRMGILAEAGTDLRAAAAADVVVLATPVRTLLRQIPLVAPLAGPGAVLTDVGSTKRDVLETFRRSATRAAVVGGHPMAGNEKAGLDGCDPDLFERRPWVLIPGPRAGRRSRRTLERLVSSIGARPVWMDDPARHDLAVARISHVPYLLAYALMEQPGKEIRVAGNSFRDATRVALSDPDMVLDFLLTNRGPVARASVELAARLRNLALLVSQGAEKDLRRRLEKALRLRSGL
jgi:prephenate dehydrogenase